MAGARTSGDRVDSVVTVGELIGTILGSTILTALVTVLGSWAVAKIKARSEARLAEAAVTTASVAEKRQEDDSTDALISRWKDATEDERAQKDSAVALLRNLLSIAETQIEALKDTLVKLTETVRVMTVTIETKDDDLRKAMESRDGVLAALATAEAQAADYRGKLEELQEKLGMTPTPTGGTAIITSITEAPAS